MRFKKTCGQAYGCDLPKACHTFYCLKKERGIRIIFPEKIG